jgi:aryl-alcohol dehydrogenase-like predicted oxidoreductase
VSSGTKSIVSNKLEAFDEANGLIAMREDFMEQRRLGDRGLAVSMMGLGCMGMSASYGKGEEAENIRVIHRAIELGINFFDTAEAYGPYENEVLLGKALQGRRDKVIIATKFGFQFKDGKVAGVDGSPANVKRAASESLKRLDTDHIDLFYQHRKDSNVPIEETIGAMADLVKEGKVRYLGLSEVGPQTIQRAHAVHPIAVLQSEYSIWERGIEERILPLLRELHIGFVPFSPLGRGYLTGKIQSLAELSESDYRQHDPRFVGENFQKNLQILDVVKQIAGELVAAPSQIALAWVMQQGSDVVPIPGTKRMNYLEENVAATRLKLTPAQLGRLKGLAQITSGPRYNEVGMARVER